MKTSLLKPGFLVSLKTSLRGGVHYRRQDIEQDHTTTDGARLARWETTREIPDPDEFERATQARGKARAVVSGACCLSAFGLLCPDSKESELQEAIAIAKGIAQAHNDSAAQTRVDVFVLIGRIAQNDEEAARAIGAEVRDLLDAMRAGIKDADPAAIREAANKARSIGGMLSADVAGQVSAAIIEAREAARAIVRRVEKAGETAAAVVAECSLQRIDAARFAFLDMEAGEFETQAPAGRGLDLPPDEPETEPERAANDEPARLSAAPTQARALELF